MNHELRFGEKIGSVRCFGALLLLLLSACAPSTLRVATSPARSIPPYPYSRVLAPIDWDFTSLLEQRKAHGSDLWPCAWAADDALYCAWGDGGGFDGDDDHIGRVSLGFARIEGTPSQTDPGAVHGKNVWGEPPYADVQATFGGKVGNVVALKGVLYASGGFWTVANTDQPTRKSGRGPLNSLAWSTDSARSWQIAPWSSQSPLGSFIDRGRDSLSAQPDHLYLYYQRTDDDRHLYLQRISSGQLITDPANGGKFEYFTGTTWLLHTPRWSSDEKQAVPIFFDRNHVEGASAVYDAPLNRYLLTTGHYASGNDDDSSAGQVGIFEAPNPWGPWSTLGYYENWGNLQAETAGDYLSLRIPSKWISADGKTVWAVFSGLKSFDSFNLVRGSLSADR